MATGKDLDLLIKIFIKQVINLVIVFLNLNIGLLHRIERRVVKRIIKEYNIVEILKFQLLKYQLI